MNVGKTIRAIREQKGWSQVTLAKYSGINVNSIRKYELGIRNPKAEQVDKIADALQVNRSVFYDLNIMTVGDVMSLLFLIDEATNLTIKEAEGDGNKKFIIEFEHPPMTDAISTFCTFKEKYHRCMDAYKTLEDEEVKNSLIEEMNQMQEDFKSVMLVSTPDCHRVITKDVKPGQIAIQIPKL